MQERGHHVITIPHQQVIARARARMAFETVTVALHEIVVGHNARGGNLLEIHEQADCVEVFQRGLIFPSLRILFDLATLDVSYQQPARCADAPPTEGTIVPGFNECLLMIDSAGIAHRIRCKDLAATLLAPAMQAPTMLKCAA
jgi:hypothetical protein